MSEVIEKFGIVVLLDALGVQGASIDESKSFISALKNHADGSLDFIDGFASGANDETSSHYEKTKPIVRTFGDTYLLTWELPSETNILIYLETVASSVGFIISDAIESGFLFRGAISIGRYLESDTTIIGPAITDVASWHEYANWFGCITTPNCNERIKSEINETEAPFSLIKYSVPFKSRGDLILWCVDWPKSTLGYSIKSEKDANTRKKWYYKNISKLQIPIGTEDKYLNAEKFLIHCLSNKANSHGKI